MSIEKPILKLYNTDFTLVALIDDYQQAQIEHNLYSAGAFSISINYNIPNARLFQRGLFLQFGNNARDFCVIQSVENSIGSSGKGSEYITVSGYDCRYLFKRRIIKNLNSNDTWSMTAKGELCIRSLVADQCGVNAEEKRKLPITNIIPNETDAIGSTYSVSEAYSNLYDTLVTIATQSEIGWAVEFNGSSLNLVVYQGENKSNNVFFSTDFESLANGEYKDSNDSYSNSVYIGGKGTGSERDIYEGEVDEPEGLDRFESYDDQSSMTTEEEYEEKARSILSQYGQTITVSGAGLAKCPYVFREQYDIGDIIKLSFSGKSANTQILSVSESWAKGSYSLSFDFGKPVNTLSDQLSIMLRKIQGASNKSSATTSVKWYTLPDDTEQNISDVTFDTLGFTGEIASGGSTFTLGFNSEGVGCKTYIIYIKNLTGSDELTLTTGTDSAENITFNQGTYIAAVTVDTEGNVIAQSVTEATHAQNADRASKDSAGNVITTTYATKAEVPTNNNHNIPRKTPKDITSYITEGSLWKRLNGTDGYALFEDIYVGDYIRMSRPITVQGSYDGTVGSQYVTIAGINTLQGNGDNIDMNYNHLVMVPGQGFGGIQHFGRRRMNSTSTTAGGYVSSEMHTTHIGAVANAGDVNGNINQQLYAEFGSHLKTTRELLTNDVNASGVNRFGSASGCSSNWGWYSCQAVLMSEIECYGSTVWSSSGYDTGVANHWLPLFQYSNNARNDRTAFYWLKDVASSVYFCFSDYAGNSTYSSAGSGSNCVRPRFVIA